MQLPAFVAALNQLLQTRDPAHWLGGISTLVQEFLGAKFSLEESPGIGPDSGLKLPIYADNALIAVLTLSRTEADFSADECMAAEILQSVCTIILRHENTTKLTDRKRRTQAVRAVINTLSYSELSAAVHIMQALQGPEGLLVAGHIADKLGFTRSVVVNALRKLEGAGTIETRSLGMKGTHIRVHDLILLEELRKLRSN